jgi:hypothetical protein
MEPPHSVRAHVDIDVFQRKRQPHIRFCVSRLCSPSGSYPNISGTLVVFFMLWLPCWTSTLNATTFAVIKMDNVIGIAADSRVTLTVDYSKEERGPDICKIRKCGPGLYVVGAGSMINIKTGTDFGSLAMRACNRRGIVQDKADWFEHQAIEAGKLIQAEDKKSPAAFAVVFAGYDGTTTFFSKRGFYATPSGIRAEDRIDCFDNCPAKGHVTYVFGAFQRTMNLMLSDISIFADGPTKAAENLVGAEIKADRTGKIGFPMSVLEIRATGARWIQRGACQNDPADQ